MSTYQSSAKRPSGGLAGSVWPGAPEAYLSGRFYQWSPHSGQRLAEFKSNVAAPGEDWQKMALEFATPKWGPFIQLTFHAENCTVYLDDFRFVRVGAAK